MTEGGYNFDDVTGEFDAGLPDVAHDLQPGATPRTTFGLVTEALGRRRERGLPPFTVMSCDNLQGNGEPPGGVSSRSPRCAILNLVTGSSSEVRFPNSMVDRITPVTTDEDQAEVARAVRHRRPVAGGLRAVHPMGARGQFP